MHHIPTTATAVQKLRDEARRLAQSRGVPLMAAQEHAAVQAGYDNWKHVCLCVEATTARATPPLPNYVADFLADQVRRHPPCAETRAALDRGLVFAMDVKDADGLDCGEHVAACDDAWPIVAADLLRDYLDDDTDADGDPEDFEAQLQGCKEWLVNYRLFRYTGERTGPTLDHAFADVLVRYFFAPTHLWLDGRVVDMAQVERVRVDGKIVYWSTQGPDGSVVSMYAAASDEERGTVVGFHR